MSDDIQMSRWQRQRKVFELAVRGVSPAEIARRLGIPDSTVRHDIKMSGLSVVEKATADEEQQMGLLKIVLDVDEELQDLLAKLKAAYEVEGQFLVLEPEPGRAILNPIAHDKMMVIAEQIANLLRFYSEVMGKIIPRPQLIQNNTNITIEETNPEIARMRQIYEEARKTRLLMEQVEKAAKEGAAEYEATDVDSHEGDSAS